MPLEERQLPDDFNALPEDEQWRRLEATARVAFAWALGEGANQVRISTYEKADQARLLEGGFEQVARYDFLAPASSQSMAQAVAVVIFDRIWVTRGSSVTLYVHETWDSLVVADTNEAVDRLRQQLPRY